MPQDPLIPPTTLVAGYTRIPARYHTLTLTMPVIPRAKRNPRIQARDGDTKTPERSGFKLKLKNPDFKRHTVAIAYSRRDCEPHSFLVSEGYYRSPQHQDRRYQ